MTIFDSNESQRVASEMAAKWNGFNEPESITLANERRREDKVYQLIGMMRVISKALGNEISIDQYDYIELEGIFFTVSVSSTGDQFLYYENGTSVALSDLAHVAALALSFINENSNDAAEWEGLNKDMRTFLEG